MGLELALLRGWVGGKASGRCLTSLQGLERVPAGPSPPACRIGGFTSRGSSAPQVAVAVAVAVGSTSAAFAARARGAAVRSVAHLGNVRVINA